MTPEARTTSLELDCYLGSLKNLLILGGVRVDAEVFHYGYTMFKEYCKWSSSVFISNKAISSGNIDNSLLNQTNFD